MGFHRRAFVAVLLFLGLSANVRAEVLIRWDRDQVPSATSLGISTLVVPAAHSAAVHSALGQGYRVYLEVEGSTLVGFTPPAGIAGVVVKGTASEKLVLQLAARLKPRGARVLTLEERGKWPHIRSNWVTRNNEVLQVSGRSAQPWIENNAALLRIARAARPGSTPLLTYSWEPTTLADGAEGPRLEDYLVAIAEAGSFGGDLLLPLHERFQTRLLMGHPQARSEWNDIRRYVEFYSWNLPARYQPIANIGVVTAEPMLWFEAMNLLARHNLPFQLVPPAELPVRDLAALKLLIVLDAPGPAELKTLTAFERSGGKIVIAGPSSKPEGGDSSFGSLKATVLKGISDPNTFALEMRQVLGREQRVIDIWNGITVLTAPYQEPNGSTVLVTALNYAHDPLPVQIRVAGTFSLVHYESPEDAPALLPYQQRDGYTEFVLPALRVGGRVFLTR
jgi:hypothetical protein